MALLTVDEGEVILLQRALNNVAPDNCILRLYTNDKTPADADTTASYTELTAHNYTAITLTGASWSISSIANVATASYALQTFTLNSGPQNVYGYYVTNAAGTKVLWAERFTSTPFVIPAVGTGTINITPVITHNHA
jgi:hypothetical protein